MTLVHDAAVDAPGPRPASSDRPSPARGLRVSVVIPTFRRPELIVRCLEALVAQHFDLQDFEVLVVDDGRTADTQAAVHRFAAEHPAHAIRYLRPQDGHGPAAARNWGWRGAGAPIIAFTDDDTVPEPDWLAHGVGCFGPGVAAVAGQVRVPLREAAGGHVVMTDHDRMTVGLESAEFVTANAFVRREALVAIGGFDERFARAWREDSDLQFCLLEARARIVRCPEALVRHPVRPEAWGVSLRQQKNVFYDALLYKKHPGLYRQRILPSPPWNYYVVVGTTIAFPIFLALDNPGSAAACVAIAAALVGALAWRRLRQTSLDPAHVLEMLATSLLIPFLSVYWRLRGAIHFRVLYL